jgi:hypothetical protein
MPRRRIVLRLVEPDSMRLMLGLWGLVICGGLTYFIVIGLTHH